MKVFICHTSSDESYVQRLAGSLERIGIECWFFERDNHSKPIGGAIDDALAECDCMIFVMTQNVPNITKTPYIQNELNTFVELGKTIIPLRVQKSPPWRPHGSRSLIQSLPVVDDHDGTIGDSIIREISRVIAHVPSPPLPSHTPYDPRLRMALDQAGILWQIDQDGDFQTKWDMKLERDQDGLSIELISRTFCTPGGLEGRKVSGSRTFHDIDEDTLRNILLHFGKASCWSVCRTGAQAFRIMYTIGIPALLPAEKLREVCVNFVSLFRQVFMAVNESVKRKNSQDDGSWWQALFAGATGVLAGLGAIALANSSDEENNS